MEFLNSCKNSQIGNPRKIREKTRQNSPKTDRARETAPQEQSNNTATRPRQAAQRQDDTKGSTAQRHQKQRQAPATPQQQATRHHANAQPHHQRPADPASRTQAAQETRSQRQPPPENRLPPARVEQMFSLAERHSPSVFPTLLAVITILRDAPATICRHPDWPSTHSSTTTSLRIELTPAVFQRPCC